MIDRDFNNVIRLRNTYQNTVNYGMVASVGTCVVMAAKFLTAPHLIFDVSISLGMAMIVDAHIERLKHRKHIQDSETSFIEEHGTSHEAFWINDLNKDSAIARKKYSVLTSTTLISLAGGCLVALRTAPSLHSVMIPALAVAAFLIHGKATQKISNTIDATDNARRTLVDHIHQRRCSGTSSDAPKPTH